MSDRLSWIEYKGARILHVDYSGISEEEFIQTIEEFKTDEVRKKFRELAEQTQGISKGAAAIGITEFKKALAVLIKRDLHYADSLEEAKEWLAEQAKK